VNVTVVWAAPDAQDVVPLALAAGATVGDAVARSGLVAAYATGTAGLAFAVWGRRVPGDRLLVDGDRVEITRPLVADPKEARRRRADAASLPRRKPVPKRGR
jgi:uncharacterized protein